MQLTEELVQYYRWLRHYGLNDSHSGNASVRDGDTVWVTPTGASADILQAADLIRCNLNELPPQGASLDTALHLSVYRQNPEAQAVLHSHGAHSVAMTLSGEDFVPVDFEGNYYFPKVPVLTVEYARYLQDAPAKVADCLANYPICVVRGHGVYAQARSLNLAYKWSCSLELSAKTAWLARLAGTVPSV